MVFSDQIFKTRLSVSGENLFIRVHVWQWNITRRTIEYYVSNSWYHLTPNLPKREEESKKIRGLNNSATYNKNVYHMLIRVDGKLKKSQDQSYKVADWRMTRQVNEYR